MNAGDALVAAGAASAALAAALAAAGVRRPALAAASRRALTASAVALGLALAWLALHFLAGWTEVAYVWEHTWTGYPWAYRLAGVWGGQKGTILLWAALLAAAASWSERLAPRGAPRAALVARAALAALVASLAGLAFADGTFAPTDPGLLALSPEGQGLVEVLVTPLMVIHPPVQFVAYALAAVPAAWAVAGLWTGEAWLAPATRAARPAWLAATLGLGLGAVWAYYVLSFGGFWAWDPVETANLLPWLALTAFLHAVRHGDAPVAAPLLAAAAALLVLFATVSTRSGLWVSVHAFTDPADRFDPDAGARFVSILDAHLPSAWLTATLVVALAVVAAAFGRALVRERPAARPWALAHGGALALVAGVVAAAPAAGVGALLEAGRVVALGRAAVGFPVLVGALAFAPAVALYLARPERAAGGGWTLVRTRPLLGGAVLLLALALVVALVLDLAAVDGADRSAFDARAPLLGVPVLALVAVAFGHRVVGPRVAVAAAAASVAAGVALALAFPARWPIGLAAPVLATTFACVFARAVQALGAAATPPMRAAGAMLLASGLLGVVMGADPPQVVLGVETSFALGAAAIAGGFLAIAGGVAALTGGPRALAVAGAVGGVLAVGFFAGAALAAAANVVVLRAAWPAARAPLRPALRRAGVHLAHLGLVVGLLGYTAATYAREDASLTLAPGESGAVGGMVVVYDRTEAVAWPDGASERVAAVLLLPDGDEARATFFWKGPPVDHYDPLLDVRRGWWRDVYVAPKAFHVDGVGAIREHTAPPLGDMPRFAPENVRAASFDVTVLPLMAFVWGGLWLLVGAMALVVIGSPAGEAEGRRRAGPVSGSASGDVEPPLVE